MPKNPKPGTRAFSELNAELEEVMAWFETEHIDIDQAATQYEKARVLIAELETHLQKAENTIEKIKLRFDES